MQKTLLASHCHFSVAVKLSLQERMICSLGLHSLSFVKFPPFSYQTARSIRVLEQPAIGGGGCPAGEPHSGGSV